MQLVEQRCIARRDPRYAVIYSAAFKSKNLYNAASYEYRQAFIHQGKYLNYNELQKRMQSHEAYKALPAKVSQRVLMVLDNNWKGFREGLKAYYEDPSKLQECPPEYKHKTEGETILMCTIQAIIRGKNGLKRELMLKRSRSISSVLQTSTNQSMRTKCHERLLPHSRFFDTKLTPKNTIHAAHPYTDNRSIAGGI